MKGFTTNAVIAHAQSKRWSFVRFTLIYQTGRIAAVTSEEVIPDEVLNLPVDSHYAEIRENTEDRAMFWSYATDGNVFINENHIPPTEGPEPVIIVMEPVEKI
ncbi:hypothetical protein [Paenibacillus macquariensis]|uniref:Uncharacterized protein n=1 Tax=Paenibacillus macquariensis TaxID=948756 RepID=A0ABY1JXX6_9BACL|nr:hypothetical protein [Paenibacillus macquariensis]MEC0089347.1 hypothetical protein [Paenibacillus macquariensis]OAB33253.1 hypothetical protein PMSM_14660 [Paenibacillus macquariensis subsp. macquariensis]SIQ93308.1 hypothetical protein SAMN05421578_105111 [Paenibacillus macquariensis]